MLKKENKIRLEFYGISVDDAVQKAIKELNVPRETLVVKVVSEEKKGLFGMEGEKPAKIIVSLKRK
ncbi:MAG TPA: Jag N-terminal domain-containing protein [Candidatus Omnitrophota bacterium]|nr:Jag N-terminal domain-containing protein [Candidatus Omnitrophota bacterium]HQL41730.1 Jag N-terminal domain-containing protein [Candidatus Omnitrophota bacterium]